MGASDSAIRAISLISLKRCTRCTRCTCLRIYTCVITHVHHTCETRYRKASSDRDIASLIVNSRGKLVQSFTVSDNWLITRPALTANNLDTTCADYQPLCMLFGEGLSCPSFSAQQDQGKKTTDYGQKFQKEYSH